MENCMEAPKLSETGRFRSKADRRRKQLHLNGVIPLAKNSNTRECFDMNSTTPPTQGFSQSGTRSIMEIVVLLGFLAALGGGVVWGASRFSDWVLPVVPLSVDKQVGQMAFQAMKASGGVCPNDDIRTYVESLLQPLAAAEGVDPKEFEVAVLDEDIPNASALPGGYILVHWGLIETADDGAEISAVLAHELAHVKMRHGMRRVLRTASAGILFNLLVGGTDIASLAGYAEDVSHRAYDRDQEREADDVGRATLKKANISPAALGRFFEKLKKEEPVAGIPTFLSTHPELAERIEKSNKEGMLDSTRSLPKPEGLSCQ